MDILQITGLGIVAAIIIALLKNHRQEMSIQVSIAAGLVIFLIIAGKLSAVIDFLNKYASRVNIDTSYFGILLKIIGIAYIAEFGAEICKDAGEGAIATKIELAGKVIILILAVPIITSLLEMVVRIMP